MIAENSNKWILLRDDLKNLREEFIYHGNAFDGSKEWSRQDIVKREHAHRKWVDSQENGGCEQ